MKLSLSVRVAEAPGSKEETIRSFDEIATLADQLGYSAVCMRASQAGIQTPLQQITAIRQKTRQLNLAVSMVTGDFPIPINNDQGPDALRNITPYLDLTDLLGANLIRIAMKKEEDIIWAKRASDEARERGIRLAHQSHTRSLFETVDGSVDILKRVGRNNFGIIYEPANLDLCGQDYGPKRSSGFRLIYLTFTSRTISGVPMERHILRRGFAGMFHMIRFACRMRAGSTFQMCLKDWQRLATTAM